MWFIKWLPCLNGDPDCPLKQDLHVVHIVAPTAHWGLRTPAKTSIYLWFTQWLLRLNGDPEPIKRRDLYDVDVKWLPGSLRTHNDRNYLDLQVVHGVALRAQWGSRRSTMAQPTCHLCKIHIHSVVAPAAHWGHGTLKITRCTWRWYAVAPGVRWGCRKSGKG